MRKLIFGRRLKRDRKQRKALFRSLMNSLILYGKIRTTEAKAKSIKGEIEKMVTLARNREESAKNLIRSRLLDERAVDKIVSEIAPKVSSRPGGYTRILRIGRRTKDGAKMVLMSWTEEIAPTLFKEPKRKVKKAVETKTKGKEIRSKSREARSGSARK